MKNNHAGRELREFAALLKKIFGPNLKKVILFGDGDLFLLFLKLSDGDKVEVNRLAEEWSKDHRPISPLALDEKAYLALKSSGRQLARDIEKTGVTL